MVVVMLFSVKLGFLHISLYISVTSTGGGCLVGKSFTPLVITKVLLYEDAVMHSVNHPCSSQMRSLCCFAIADRNPRPSRTAGTPPISRPEPRDSASYAAALNSHVRLPSTKDTEASSFRSLSEIHRGAQC